MTKLRKGSIPLSISHPNLVKEWDYDKNAPLSPDDVSAGSPRRVWWVCKHGHEWNTRILSRGTQNSGCPYCSGRLPISGINDVLTVNSSVAQEWDYKKNYPLTPDKASAGSSQKVWWICKYGHNWEAQIASRAKHNSGCPYCTGRLAISGINDLLTLKPDVAKEWDYDKNAHLLPSEVLCGSQKKAWWICKYGHSWETTISNRTAGKGCPYCSGHKTLSGFNDLETWCTNNNRYDLIEEWNYEKNNIVPRQISPKNNRKVWWKCALGHEWDSTIGSRTGSRPSGCPYCSNPPKKVLVGFNDFESWCISNNKSYLLAEWNTTRNSNLSPQDITYGSGKKVWWRCNRGHEWCVSAASRAKGTGCPICSRTQTSFPEQAIAYYLSKTFNILQRYRIQNNEVDIYLVDHLIGIEYDGLYFHKDENSTREKEKNACLKEHGIRLIRIKESKTKTCLKGDVLFYVVKKSNYLDDSFNIMLHSLISYVERITGVRAIKDIDVCRDELAIREHYASIIKNNSVAALYPELVPEWDVEKNNGMTPDNFTANANIKVWWKCSNGHSWQALISSRGRKLGCPYCAGQKTLKGNNDLESWCKFNAPYLLEEWNYEMNNVLPSDISKTSNKKAWWICSRGHVWEAVIANRVHGTCCPICNTGNNTKRNDISLYQWCKNNNKDVLLSEWDEKKNLPLTPHDVSKGSHKKAWWKCKNGHEWEAQIKSRTYNHGCPYCSGTYKKAQMGINDLVTWCKLNHKEYILDEWDYNANGDLAPEMFTFGSHKSINWICKNGHSWNAIIKERTKYKGNMCPQCRQNYKNL